MPDLPEFPSGINTELRAVERPKVLPLRPRKPRRPPDPRRTFLLIFWLIMLLILIAPAARDFLRH